MPGLSPQYKPIEVKKLDASAASGSQAEMAPVIERIDASFRQDWQAPAYGRLRGQTS